MQANLELFSISDISKELPLSFEFALEIENLVKHKKLSYIEAITHWCEINGKDISVGADLVKKSTVLKAKIQAEAEDLNLLPKGAKLPI